VSLRRQKKKKLSADGVSELYKETGVNLVSPLVSDSAGATRRNDKQATLRMRTGA